MKTLLLNVYDEKVEEMDIVPTLSAYYEAIDTGVIDIVTRKIGGKVFDIVCDDEGIFHDPQKISAICDFGTPMLVGNLLFFHNDGEGNLTGLDDKDIEHLKDHIENMSTIKYPNGYPILTQCEYA